MLKTNWSSYMKAMIAPSRVSSTSTFDHRTSLDGMDNAMTTNHTCFILYAAEAAAFRESMEIDNESD